MASTSCAASAGAIAGASGRGLAPCVCIPGWFSRNGSVCEPFMPPDAAGMRQVDNLTTVFDPPLDFRSYSAGAKEQRWFFVATVVTVAVWLVMTLVLRLMPLQGWWFRVRYYISRWDRRFSKRHWLDEQKVQVKRRTELGGACSVASIIFLVGLSAGLVYELVVSAKVTQQNLIPANGREMLHYNGNYSFSITTVSSMKCSQASGFNLVHTSLPYDEARSDTVSADKGLVTGCEDTPLGPKVHVGCAACRFARDDYDIRFSFRDDPASGLLATAVGFALNVSTHACSTDEICLAAKLEGMLVGGSDGISTSNATLRGSSANALEFRIIPRLFRRDTGSSSFTSPSSLLNYTAIPDLFREERGSVTLLETLFHSYVPGEFLTDTTALNESLRTASGVAVTIRLKILSSYIVNTREESTIGFVTFLARFGGIYSLSLSIFFFLMMQSELRIKCLRYDDKLLNRLEARRQAQARWDKVRLYVRYANFHRMVSLESPAPSSRHPDADVWRHVSASRAVSMPADLRLGRSDPASWREDTRHVGEGSLTQHVEEEGPELHRSLSLSTGRSLPRTHSLTSLRRSKSTRPTPPIAQWLTVKMLERNVSKNLEREEREMRAADRSVELQEVRVEAATNRGGVASTSQVGEDPPPFKEDVGSSSSGVGDRGGSVERSTSTSQGGGDADLDRDPSSPHGGATAGGSERHISDVLRDRASASLNDIAKRVRDVGKMPTHMSHMLASGTHGHDEMVGHRRKVRARRGYGSASQYKGTIVRQYRPPSWLTDQDPLPQLPQPPRPPMGDICAADKFAMYNYLQDMYEYRVRLRERFLIAESMLEDVVQRFRPHSDL